LAKRFPVGIINGAPDKKTKSEEDSSPNGGLLSVAEQTQFSPCPNIYEIQGGEGCACSAILQRLRRLSNRLVYTARLSHQWLTLV
jgi:hypothetical protein